MNHIDDSFLHCLVFKEHRRSLGFFVALASRPFQYTRFSESCQAPFFTSARTCYAVLLRIFHLLSALFTTCPILHEIAPSVNIFFLLFCPPRLEYERGLLVAALFRILVREVNQSRSASFPQRHYARCSMHRAVSNLIPI